MVFLYQATDPTGAQREGVIDAVTMEVAISSLQRRGLIIVSIKPEGSKSLLTADLKIFQHVSTKDIVIVSRQMSTLFSAQVSALQVFRLLGAECDNKFLGRTLNLVADDLQGGSSISKALSKHPKVFTPFYVNMVKSGEEAGKLDEVLLYLADYLDRTYEVTSKAKNALIYPIFVILVFIAVMTLMLTMVIPNISKILVESGQEIPFYTKVVLGISNILVHYGIWVLIGGIILGFFGFRYGQTQQGRMFYSRVKISIPFIGALNKKLFLARIADNLNTMLLSAIPIVKALDITASVVENAVYEQILKETVDAVRTGSSLSVAMARHKEIPGIMVQMMRVGEETGELGDILKTLANFYNREVKNAVDTLIGLIEPAMIVFLGVGVAVLLASVLIPIYNISGGV